VPAVFQAPANQPQSNPAAPQQPQQQDTHALHASVFQKILGMITPKQTYVDSQGNVQTVRPSLSSSILAGAVAGMFAKPVYREGAFGPVYDSRATAAGAYDKGAAMQQEKNDAAQKQQDEIMTRKMAVAKNAIDTEHLRAALHMQQQQELAQVADRNNSTILPISKSTTTSRPIRQSD
jgi:hypothetical protein